MFSKHRRYIFIQGLAVVLVMVFFHFISEKRVASLFATSSFLLGSGLVLFLEGREGWRAKSLSTLSTLAFVIAFVVPIIFIRVLSWNGNFEEQSLFGLTGAQFHKVSNYAFLLMLVCYFIESLKESGARATTNEKTQS